MEGIGAMVEQEDAQMLDNQTKKLAENLTLIVVARISMVLALPALGVMWYLFSQNLDQKFAAQDVKITASTVASTNQSSILTSRIETVERTTSARIETSERALGTVNEAGNKISERLTVVETKQAQADAAREKFETAVLSRLDRMQDSIVQLTSAIAAQGAVQNLRSERTPRELQAPER